MTLEQIKEHTDLAIRQKTTQGSILPEDVATAIDNIADFLNVPQNGTDKPSRVLNTEPDGGWLVGDLWIYTDNGYFFEFRKITAISPAVTYDTFAILSDGRQLYSAVTSGEMAIQPGDTGSFPTLQIVLNAPSSNQYYTFANETITAAYNPGGGAPVKTFNIFPHLKSKAGDPTTGQIPTGYYGVYEDTDTGDLKLWCNHNGVMKSISFT